MRVGSKPSTPTALRGASSLQVLEGLLQKSALNGRKAPEVEESGEILAKNISSNCLSKNLAHNRSFFHPTHLMSYMAQDCLI